MIIVPTCQPSVTQHPHRLQADMENRLAAMSPPDFAHVVANSVEIELVRSIDLVAPEEPILDCWFPLAKLISIIATAASGLQTDVGVARLEGSVDIATMHGGDRSIQNAVVQIFGRPLRAKAVILRKEMMECPMLSALLLAYAQAFTVQMAGTALANAQFTIGQRLARWLLMCADRAGPTGIVLTHETLSIMLGVADGGHDGVAASGTAWNNSDTQRQQ